MKKMSQIRLEKMMNLVEIVLKKKQLNHFVKKVYKYLLLVVCKPENLENICYCYIESKENECQVRCTTENSSEACRHKNTVNIHLSKFRLHSVQRKRFD